MSELLFEVGCEEIPARVVPEVLEFFKTRAAKLASDYGLEVAGDVAVFGTPRRLTLSVTGLGDTTLRTKKELAGPPVRAAFDANGKPTKAAEGFAKTAGVKLSDLERKQTPKGEYLFATVEQGGEPAPVVLERFLGELLASIPFAKSMRWGNEEVRFARPVQWLLALFSTDSDARVIPLSFGGVRSAGLSRGHRFMANDPFQPTRRKDYVAKLAERMVIAEPTLRRTRVLEEARRAAKEAGGVLFGDPNGAPVDALTRATYFDSLLDEITFLCETPFAVFGTFDPSALELPREVILAAMRNHQRYFAVADKTGALLPAFVTIAATRTKDPALVRRGNERVLKARLSDARYFLVEDQKRPLEVRIDDLKSVTYHKKIGSSFEKVERVAKLAEVIRLALGRDAPNLARAVRLAKADLTTLMVGEFPELQGIVGAAYAAKSGEPADVVEAIRDHYKPRSAEDAPAEGVLSAIVSLADKLDTIAGIGAIGQMPTGSSDPFALRRAALGILRTLLHHRWPLDLVALTEAALDLQPVKRAPDSAAKLGAFFADRFLNHFVHAPPGGRADIVRAVVAAGVAKPVEAHDRVHALARFAEDKEFAALTQTLKRALNISHGSQGPTPGAVDAALFQHDAERALYGQTAAAAKAARGAGSVDAIVARLHAVALLRPTVDAFFTAVMVMDKDERVKDNRLRLLKDVVALVTDIADFKELA